MEVITIISTLSKLIGLGVASHKAYQTEGFTDEDLLGLKAFLETGSGLLGRKSTTDKPVGAIQLALIARSFGVAFGRHWAFNDLMVPGSSRFPTWARKIWDNARAKRYEEIELRLNHADLKALTPGEQDDPVAALKVLSQLTSHPLDNPYYRALWGAFGDPALDDKDPLMSLVKDGDARDFEKYFRQAYIEALATPDGQRVQKWHIELASEKNEALLHGLMLDMAGWGRRHVFGNAIAPRPNDVLPFMALDDVYVEPFGCQEDVRAHEAVPVPIKGLIRQLLSEHHLVVVKADFGHGKSLTARGLAKDLASEWLSDNATPGPALRAPVFVRCARDIVDASYEHDIVIRRALWNQAADALGVDISMGDPMFAPPQQQETLFILDGLDEVAFTQNQRKELFTRLKENVRGKHRAVVFTRPGALDQNCLPKGTPVVELLSFQGDEQIEIWLKSWNVLRGQTRFVSLAMVHAAGLGEIAKVPILLLMIAMTVAEFQGETEAVAADKSVLYERFFSHIARGKLEQGGEEHQPIAQASKALLACLVGKKILTDDANPVDAMLWLMSRVAWRAHVYAYRPGGKPLRVDEVKVDIIGRELGLESDVRPAIELGLILAMQMDPDGGSKDILFGHQSFREFLVARYWLHELRLLVRPRVPRGQKEEVEKHFQEARLLEPGDAAFSMLKGMLDRLSDTAERLRIQGWAEAKVNDEDLTEKRLRDDTSYKLRESALAIGSCIGAITVEDPLTLRTLAANFFLHNKGLILRVPKLVSPHAALRMCTLREADFSSANLQGADFSRANLEGANFAGANLVGANFGGATLIDANLEGVDLGSAELGGANLSDANLKGANLRGANLEYAHLMSANLAGAKLSGGRLRHAYLGNAYLEGADLRQANLMYARLDGAQLSGAKLSGARLVGARLAGAGLAGAMLAGAVLRRVDLNGVDLNGVDLSGVDFVGGANDGDVDLGDDDLLISE